MNLNDDVLALLRQPSICYLATTMPDGSPQVTQTWVDTDGEHVPINSVQTHLWRKGMITTREGYITMRSAPADEEICFSRMDAGVRRHHQRLPMRSVIWDDHHYCFAHPLAQYPSMIRHHLGSAACTRERLVHFLS